MANNVSDVSVRLSTDPQRFIQGFEDARKSVQPLANAVGSLNTALTGFNIGGFAGRFASIVSPLQSLAGNIASRNIGGAVADAVNLAAAISQIGGDALKTASSQAKMADQLGMSQEGFQGLAVFATRFGLDLDQITHGVSKFNSHIGQMRTELARGELPPLALALRRMGIDARQFAELRTDAQLREIAAALQRFPNMQDRRYALSQIFGEREGVVFERLLNRGAAELTNAENEAIRRGIVLYGERRRVVDDAARAQREFNAEMENAWNAFGREVGVRTAPIANDVTRGIQGQSSLTGKIIDAYWAVFGFRGSPLDNPNSEASRRQQDAISRENAFKQLKSERLGIFVGPDPNNRSGIMPDGSIASNVGSTNAIANAEAEQYLAALRRQTEAIGLSASEAYILHANLDQLNPLVANQIREQERINEQNQQQVSQAQQVRQRFEQARPLFSFQLEMQRIRNNNRLNSEDRRFAAFDAIQRLESSLPRFTTQYAGAFQMGSAEAVSAITQARAQQMDSEMSPQDRLATIMERAATSQERLEFLMQSYFDALGRYGIVVAPQA